jgi:hypothetical protein
MRCVVSSLILECVFYLWREGSDGGVMCGQGALAAVGNKEGVMGLVRVASKHGLHPSPAMLLAASAAATQDTQDILHMHHSDMTEESQST